jgi:membrane protein implicated in regulation of membrane protease activity
MLKGAFKSKTVWWNVLLAVLGGLELMGGHMTVLWGQEVAAAILMVGALANLVLRSVTTQALSEK